MLFIIFMAAVQALTEFLPVSSSGHLAALEQWFGVDESFLALAIVLHAGTLVSVLVYFRSLIGTILGDMVRVLSRRQPFGSSQFKLACYAVIACVPAVVAVVLIKKLFLSAFESLAAIGIFLLINGIVLMSLRRCPPGTKTVQQISVIDALLIGVAQCIAILPGISRSGSTITAARWRGFRPDEAFQFSFLMAIPAIAGSVVFDLRELIDAGSRNLVHYAVGFGVAALVGYGALALVRRFVASERLYVFSWYSWVVGTVVIVAALVS